MKTLKLLPLLFIPLLLSACELMDPLPTTTEVITFNFINDTSRTVHLLFYSESRDVAWPGGDRVYVLDPHGEQEYRLECRTTEKICWGASPANNYYQYWGAGADGEQYCSDCCYTCYTTTVQTQRLGN